MGGGGTAGQASRGSKLDARARIHHLVDGGTFQEFGTLVGGEMLPMESSPGRPHPGHR